MYVLLTGGVALVPMRHLEHRNATPFSKIMTPFFGKKCYICATETKSLKIKELKNMKTKLYMIALAAISMMLGSCSDSNSEFSQDYLADTPIKLNVSVDEPTTRAGYSSTELPEGFWLTVVHYLDSYHNVPDGTYSYEVWAKKVGDIWKTYKTYELDDGTLGVTDEEVTMLWANMKDNVDVMAYTKIQNFTIPTAQTSDEQLKQADVLYMPPTDIDPSKEGIKVALQHAMSKINLTIELGSEFEFTEDINKKITDVKIDGSLVSDWFTLDGQHQTEGNPQTITPFYTGATPFSKDANGVITKATATYEAILIPQTIASGKFTVSFKVDGKLYEWVYNNEAGLTLAPSTAYTLKLIAGDDKVQPVSFSVAPWNAGNGENGEEKETD